MTVSIQLVSPASGELLEAGFKTDEDSFHSISFPSEWGVQTSGCTTHTKRFPFN